MGLVVLILFLVRLHLLAAVAVHIQAEAAELVYLVVLVGVGRTVVVVVEQGLPIKATLEETGLELLGQAKFPVVAEAVLAQSAQLAQQMLVVTVEMEFLHQSMELLQHGAAAVVVVGLLQVELLVLVEEVKAKTIQVHLPQEPQTLGEVEAVVTTLVLQQAVKLVALVLSSFATLVHNAQPEVR